MIGLLLMVALVSMVYEVLVAAAVIAGTRARCTEGRWPGADGHPARPPVGGTGAGAPGPARLLASDREREGAGTRIADAMAEGRLSLEEGVDRLEAACEARERTQLDVLVADLPCRRATRSGTGPAERGRGLPTVAVAVAVAAALVQVAAGVWILWPAAVVLLLALARVRQR